MRTVTTKEFFNFDSDGSSNYFDGLRVVASKHSDLSNITIIILKNDRELIRFESTNEFNFFISNMQKVLVDITIRSSEK